MKNILKLSRVSVQYKNKIALNSINAEFPAPGICAIVGKSGSGKTTLAKAIAGILPYEGEITLNGEKPDPRRHRIALVPQNLGLIPWKTVAENIALPLKLRQVYNEADLQAITQELGIGHLLKAWPNHLSGGEQQRVAMARAFLAQPHILLLDEAFSALDAITKDEAHQTFLRACGKRRVTTLIITHDVAEALTLAPTIVVLKAGNIAQTLDNPFWGQAREADFPAYLALERRIKEAL